MNLLLLAIAVRAWRGPALSIFLRVMAAIALLSIEVQLATWSGVATIRTLLPINALMAFGALGLGRSSAAPASVAPGFSRVRPTLPPVAAMAALAVVVLALAARLPVTGADPYHLHRVDQITGLGTLAYDPAALDIKINALAGVYELLLADLRIPGMRTALVRFHGLLGLAFYLLAIAVVQAWLPVRRRWLLIVFLVVPVVFHQLVLVKNDLFGAIPAFVALAWVVASGRGMTPRAVAAAAALAGFAVGIKISSAPIALVVLAFVVVDHRREWRAIAAVIAGGGAGAFAGGLCFTLIENQRVYGGALEPYVALGNRSGTPREAVTSAVRLAVSLADLGRITPRLWPGRGGWGSTFGLPLIWAAAVCAARVRRPGVQRAAVAALACFGMFAASYPDADIAHRLMLAPGLLLIAVAVWAVDGSDDRAAKVLRTALVPVLVLSAAQIARSAWLYLP